ncbi:MAG: hypothetical protein CMK59_02665 [Proteobacteria bacterium]|nr:hypothetical protein [Pseudomonadota bacterium]
MKKEFWAGIFVLFGLFSLAVVYTKLFVEEVTKDNTVYFLHANNVSGIVQGVPVMMQGYSIGSVAAIQVEYEPNLSFKVEMAVNKKVRIPRGSEVVLGTRLAGGAEIVISPPKESDAFMQPKEYLVLRSSTDVQDVLKTVSLVLEDIQVITSRGREFVEDPKQGLELRLKAIDQVISETSNLLLESIKLVQQINLMIEQIRPGVKRSVEGAEATLDNTAVLIDELGSVVEVMEDRLEEVSKAIEVIELYDPEEGTEMAQMFEDLQIAADEMKILTTDMSVGIRKSRIGERLLKEAEETLEKELEGDLEKEIVEDNDVELEKKSD